MSNAEKNSSHLKRIALIRVFCILLYVIVITFIFCKLSVFIASYILILTLVSATLYFLISKSNLPETEDAKILSDKDLTGTSRLLRYATTVLSFVSLMTTARGLQDFVFSDNEAWLSYLASFAVQAILVCFSLVYCHLYVGIRSIKTLSARGKALAVGALTVFLAFSFVISSSFSFSYISNNAYAESWPNDSEILIQQFLTKSAADLSEENDRITGVVYDRLEELNKTLSTAVENYVDSQNGLLIDFISAFTIAEYSRPQDTSDHGFLLSNEIINSWKTRYSSRATEIDGLVAQFDECRTSLAEYYNEFDRLLGNFNIKDAASDKDWTTVSSDIVTFSNGLEALSQSLSYLNTRADGLRIYIINVDFDTYRNALVEEISKFDYHVQRCKYELDDLLSRVENAHDGYAVSSGGDSLSKKLNDLQKDIYMLDNATASGNIEAEITSVSDRLSDIIADYSDSDIMSADTMLNILKLDSLVKTYSDCLRMETLIDDYIGTRLSVTYSIGSGYGSGATDESGIKYLSYDNWASERDQDFLQLFSLLRGLPSIPEQGDDEPTENPYSAEGVLNEAGRLRRDLLGEITDFEKAFNYFKYDFTFMAFFSAFIAVYFDLGAFLTGCFLYVMQHIEAHKKVSESHDDSKRAEENT